MTSPRLPFSDLTVSAVQGAGLTLLLAEPELADSHDRAAHMDNISTAMAGCYGALNRDAEKDELVKHLLEIAAAALLAVEAIDGGPRV